MMMLVDCSTCPVRGARCADCMMSALGGMAEGRSGPPADRAAGSGPAPGLPLDRAERRAVSMLLAAGLVTAEVAHAARAVRDPAATPIAGAGHRRVAG